MNRMAHDIMVRCDKGLGPWYRETDAFDVETDIRNIMPQEYAELDAVAKAVAKNHRKARLDLIDEYIRSLPPFKP